MFLYSRSKGGYTKQRKFSEGLLWDRARSGPAAESRPHEVQRTSAYAGTFGSSFRRVLFVRIQRKVMDYR